MRQIEDHLPDILGIAAPLGELVRWTNGHFFGLMKERAGVHLDRSSMAILNQVSVHGPLQIAAIANHLGLDPSTLSRQVYAAEKAGYVLRLRDETDSRRNLVAATDRGRATHQRLIAAWRGIVTELCEDMPAAERQALTGALNRFVGKFVALDHVLDRPL